jgi:hypothetical protein
VVEVKVVIDIVEHKAQRYPTIGDWVLEEDHTIHIFVSDTGRWLMNMLVAIHELVEAVGCLHGGIKQIDVDNFDIEYENSRPPGDVSEPGDCPKAPYHKQHMFASFIERAMALEFKMDWDNYEKVLNDLMFNHF